MSAVHSTGSKKERAISLRRLGLSYSEILAKIPVAKSTLSLWLHSVGLSRHQKQRLTQKKLAAMRRGWERTRQRRLERSAKIKSAARLETARLIQEPLWLAGLCIYWAEGAREKAWRTGERVAVTNMDVEMIKLFITWLQKFLKVSPDDLEYSIYIHRQAPMDKAIHFWTKRLRIPARALRIYFKPDYGKRFRKNTSDTYNCIFRVRVMHSVDLQRKIAGWVEGVVEYFNNWGVV